MPTTRSRSASGRASAQTTATSDAVTPTGKGIVGTALRFRWGPRHATVGLVIVEPASQGRRIGARLMQAALQGLDACTVLLHATPEGRGLYERLGFRRSGELRQHQGLAQPAPLVALGPHRRLRPAGGNDLPRLQALDGQARGMPRPALVAELLATADATVVLDEGDRIVGYACLRRFGRGHQIGHRHTIDVIADAVLCSITWQAISDRGVMAQEGRRDVGSAGASGVAVRPRQR